MTDAPVGVAVVGSYRATDGYPNVKWLLWCLARDPRLRLVLTRDAEDGASYFAAVSGSRRGPLATGWRMFAETFASLARLLLDPRARGCQAVYVPYPALFPLLVLGLLPRWGRQLVLADAYISLYDTVVRDRRLLPRRGLPARWLYRLERRALRRADRVLTDTECHRRFLTRLFGLAPGQVAALPLATDELHYQPAPATAMRDRPVRVVFIATFVPLHGAETVAAAALRLASRADIEFRWFGDGQCASAAAAVLASSPHRVTWRRDWTAPGELAAAIADADICLGIFGATAKAARVLPLKNYLALRVGRAVISAANDCWPGLPPEAPRPWYAVPPADAEALAAAIADLADDLPRRLALARAGQAYYDQTLSNANVIDQLVHLITVLGPAGLPAGRR